MNKINCIEIISLSSGVIGEDFVAHEVAIGEQRLKDMGVKVKYAPHAKLGIEYIRNHPKERAEDLIAAFSDEEVDMILCAIGGEDTYKLAPYLFENDELKRVARGKVFLGFSDSTMNHFMLHKVGLDTFYGQSFLADVCDIAGKMLPYSEKYLKELIQSGTIGSISPADVWYDGRENFAPDQIGVDMPSHINRGFELLQGEAVFSGKILGGCLDTIFDIFNGDRFADMPDVCKKYSLFPSLDDWKGKILLLETSEEKMSVEKYTQALRYLDTYGVFDVVSGVIFGKPMDEYLYDEYKEVIKAVLGGKNLPIVYNINIGHATPRCIIPFGVNAVVDADKQIITFDK